VPLVDAVADGLTDEVCADRPAVEPAICEEASARVDVVRLPEGAVDLEVVAPTSELQPVEPPRGRLRGELDEREIGPLACEEGDRARDARDTTRRTREERWSGC
jgi:hypothetical protein